MAGPVTALASPCRHVGRPVLFPSHALIPSLVSRILAESKRLEREEQDAETAYRAERTALKAAQDRLDASLARLDRLRRQKRLLVSRGSDMTRRGLASLDEMEELEREETSAAAGAKDTGALDAVDWNAVFDTLPVALAPFDPLPQK